VFVKLKIKLYDYDLRIYEDFTTLFQMSISFNFSLLYLLMVVYYNSNILIVKSKKWSEWQDSHLQPPSSKPGRLLLTLHSD